MVAAAAEEEEGRSRRQLTLRLSRGAADETASEGATAEQERSASGGVGKLQQQQQQPKQRLVLKKPRRSPSQPAAAAAAFAFSPGEQSGDDPRGRPGLNCEPPETAEGKHARVKWEASELHRLAEMVARDGAGGWRAKADALGTGRGWESVASKWQRIKLAQVDGGGKSGQQPRQQPAVTGGGQQLKKRLVLSKPKQRSPSQPAAAAAPRVRTDGEPTGEPTGVRAERQLTAEEQDFMSLQGGTGKHIDCNPSEPALERPFQAQVSHPHLPVFLIILI